MNSSSDASNISDKEMPSDDSRDSKNNSDGYFRESSDDESSDSEYESIIGSDNEFGPEGTQAIPNTDDGLATDKLLTPWVSSFKERVGEIISRLLDESLKFCVSGKMNGPPITSIVLLKVQKRISFPLYEDMLDSIVPAFEQSAFGRGTDTVVDTHFRNSCELRHSDFEILNTDWNAYLTDVVQPLIQRDLRLERDNGMFGTVVIQLPSFYEGGKLIVQHNHRTEEVDLGSATSPQNAFSIFYTAFYCDCEHEVLPLTKGVRACLIYNLVLTGEIQREIFPSAARLELERREADLVAILRNSWSNGQKLIYCLSHKYTQRNLSAENLKSSDRSIGRFFQKYADSCGLEVMIGILKKKKYRYAEAVHKNKVESSPRPRGRESNQMYWYNMEYGYEFQNRGDDNGDDFELDTISDVDSNDPNVCFYDDYKIKYLKSLDKERHLKLPALDVHFESEVLPENSFQDIKAFHENQEVTGNEGFQCSKFYQCAAIMVYRPDDLLPILVLGDAKQSKIEEAFLSEFRKHKDNIHDHRVKEKCLKWCHIVMDRFLLRFFADNEMQNASEMFELFLLLDDIELMRKFLNFQKFEQGNFSFVHKMCHKHGWSSFSALIISKFGKLKSEQRLVNLEKFFDYDGSETHQNATDKQIIVHRILKEMLTKFDHELEQQRRNKYKRVDKKNFLISFWLLANKVNFLPLVEYVKTKPMDIVVPVLIAVAENREDISHLWVDAAKFFKFKMELSLQRPIDLTFTWKQNVNLSCHCKHCKFVEDFLQRSYQQKLDFFGKRATRNHVQQMLAGLENLSSVTLDSAVLRITKPRKTGEIQFEEHQFVAANLSTLRSLIASAT